MFNHLKAIGLTAAMVAAAPFAANAATVGQIDIGGVVNTGTSDFAAGDLGTADVDLDGNGFVFIANGLFAGLAGDSATLTDIDFDAVGATIWSVGGYAFVAESYSSISSTAGDLSFTATGDITGNGVNQTGFLTFSAQDDQAQVSFSSTTVTPAPVPVPAAGFLLIAGLGALGIAGRKKAA